MVGDAIKTILSGVTANVYPNLVPHNRASQWVIYHQVSRIPNNTKTDGGYYDQYRFQLDIYDRTDSNLNTLASKVKNALDEYSDNYIDHIFFENETDSWETIEEEHYYRKIQDYILFVKSLSYYYTIVYNYFPDKPSIADMIIQNTMLSTLINSGIFVKCEFIDIFSVHNSSCAYINWKSPGIFNPSAVNSPTWTQYAGITGDNVNTKCINLNFIPLANGTLIGQNNICAIIGIGNDIISNREDFAAADLDGTKEICIISRTSINNSYFQCNSGSGDVVSNINGKKHYAITRNNSTTCDAYLNKTKTILSLPSTGLSSYSLHGCALNQAGEVIASNRQMRYAILASYLTETEIGIVIDAMEAYLDNYGTGLIT